MSGDGSKFSSKIGGNIKAGPETDGTHGYKKNNLALICYDNDLYSVWILLFIDKFAPLSDYTLR